MLLQGHLSTTKEGGATVLLPGSQQLFVSLRTYKTCIDCLEHDMNASDARCAPECAATFFKDARQAAFMCWAGGWRGRRCAVKGEALCARAAAAARPWTALSPAPGNGHTHEACDRGCACKRGNCKGGSVRHAMRARSSDQRIVGQATLSRGGFPSSPSSIIHMAKSS